jgi:DNA-binding transcriptional ArsR family regulator
MFGDADLSAVSALVAEPARCRIMLTLGDGRALAASVLAAEAGIAPSTASAHLAKLVDGGLLDVERHGRYRYYRLTGPDVGALLEALARVAPRHEVRSLREDTHQRQMREGRLCYDHLAGRLGVAVHQHLVDDGSVIGHDGSFRPGIDQLSSRGGDDLYRPGRRSSRLLVALDVDVAAVAAASRRPLLAFCVDWTEQRHHLAGALGAAIATRMFECGWIERAPTPRAVRLTDVGRQGLDRLQLRLPAA